MDSLREVSDHDAERPSHDVESSSEIQSNYTQMGRDGHKTGANRWISGADGGSAIASRMNRVKSRRGILPAWLMLGGKWQPSPPSFGYSHHVVPPAATTAARFPILQMRWRALHSRRDYRQTQRELRHHV
jgi:hypothetical protein